MMLKVVKNEYIKFFSGKKPYIFLLIIAVIAFLSAYMYADSRMQIINNTAAAQKVPLELKEMLLNITPLVFLKLFATDFIYKPVLQCLLIIIGIITVNTFCEDYTSGNMKFFLVSSLKKAQLFIGKIIYLLTIILLIVTANMVFGYIAGAAFFGTGVFDIKVFGEVLLVYGFSVIPGVAFATIIAILSILIRNTMTMFPLAIFISIILTTIDLFTVTKYFSPVGAMSLIGFDVISSSLNKDFILTNGVSLIYIAIGIVILTKIIKKQDILL